MDKEVIVRVYCGWDGAKNLLRQTPHNDGVWNNLRFYVDGESPGRPPQYADYCIVYNGCFELFTCWCPPGNVWLFAGEPPEEYFEHLTTRYRDYDRLYTQHEVSLGPRHYPSHAALPWHVNRSFSELCTLQDNSEYKSNQITAVVSNKSFLPGHRRRLAFLDYCRSYALDIEVYGRGHTPLPNDDKFDVLYRSKYSVAIENSYYPHYWTEKIADCFLAWTMPIYAGPPNIYEYFPEEAMIRIDLSDPEAAIETIRSAVANKRWEKNLQYIKHARDLVLHRYQFFPFVSSEIEKSLEDEMSQGKARRVRILPIDTGFLGKCERFIRDRVHDLGPVCKPRQRQTIPHKIGGAVR